MNIYVLNKSFEMINVIDEYESIIWTPRYFTYGDFELYLSADVSLLLGLQVGYYLVREQDIDGNTYKNVMIIRNLEISTDAENGNHLTVTGYCLKSLLSRRIVVNQTTLSGDVVSCIQQLINENIINPTNNARKINNFILGNNYVINTYTMKQQITGKNLEESISKICMTYGYGYDVYISNGNFVFYVYEGADRSYNQTTNPCVVFSPEYDNLLSSDYIVNNDNFANAAVVAGEGEGTARKKVTVGTATGLDRYEVWIDSRNTSSNNGEISDAEYTELLTEEGVESLSEMVTTTTFSGEIDSTINYVINQDYFLGDIVQVENDYGILATTRITEIIESEDDTGSSIIPTFAEMEVQENAN